MDEYQAYLDRLERALLSPPLQDGFRYWRGLLHGRRFPSRRELDPALIQAQLDQISLLDVLPDDPPRFRLRLVGQIDRERQGLAAGADLAQVGLDQGRERILARLRLCVGERRPIRGTYCYAALGGPESRLWAEVVSCPLSSDGATIDHVVSFGADFDRGPPCPLEEWP